MLPFTEIIYGVTHKVIQEINFPTFMISGHLKFKNFKSLVIFEFFLPLKKRNM